MNSDVFQKAYQTLNTAQKEAVDTIEGPVMVIAGPGTGKTQILTLRIAHILKNTDTQPENILALTFTESGARAMRERLAHYIGAPAYRVHIHTFHEFSGTLIRTYPDAYEKRVGGRPITDLEKIVLIENILETPTIKLLRPSGNHQFYIGPIVSALSLMKREYITPDKFSEIIEEQSKILDATEKIHEKGAHKGKVRGEYIEREKKLNKNKELLFVYRMYESLLAERGYFDYDDMIFETVLAMERNEDMLRSLQEQYQYILADEHQDVNGSQNRILELLSSFHDRPNIFVVGDEKQSIYRFQGASLENFLYFEESFPHTKTIALTENYRSAQDILDLAHELISIDAGAAKDLRIPLHAVKKEHATIERLHVSHEAVEHDSLILKVKELIDSGVPNEEIAIILRTNNEVEALSYHLRKNGIVAESSADGDILSHPITQSVRTLITAVVNPADERALFEILHGAHTGIKIYDLIAIMRNRSYGRPLSKIIGDAEYLQSIGITDTAPILRIPEVLTEARNRMSVEAPHRVLEYLLRESGFLNHVIAVDPYEGSRVIRRLYDEVEEMVRHEEVVSLLTIEAMFKTRIEHGLALTAPYIHANRHGVQVMTAHKAKGLEFLHVFIPHLVDSKWGGKSHPEYFNIPIARHMQPEGNASEDDERKLLYVALTRAKEGLYLSDSETSTEGRPLLPTRLLEGIGLETIQSIDGAVYESAFNPGDALSHIPLSTTVPIDFLTETLRERGLSVTALNNYLRDPWNYFYRNVLRIPEIQAESMQFGTVLHDTLESVMKYRREHKNTLPSTTELKTYLERELSKLPITKEEYVRHHERGLVALVGYIAHIEASLPEETKEEYKVESILKTGIPEFPEIRLTGMLDRLDYSKEGKLLRVIDYKSGKPKTRGYIEGTTKDSDGDYKRQLTFYALLLALQNDERFDCHEGVLSFIEADEKGRIHEEAFTITKDEIEALKTEIIRVVREITQGAFLNAPCDPTRSDYCNLVEIFKKSLFTSPS